MTLRITVAIAAIIVAGLGFANAQQQPNAPGSTTESPAAANVCAKLSEADCAAKEGCSWLPGFKVAGGAEVPGYCRPAPRSINARRPKE